MRDGSKTNSQTYIWRKAKDELNSFLEICIEIDYYKVLSLEAISVFGLICVNPAKFNFG